MTFIFYVTVICVAGASLTTRIIVITVTSQILKFGGLKCVGT